MNIKDFTEQQKQALLDLAMLDDLVRSDRHVAANESVFLSLIREVLEK